MKTIPKCFSAYKWKSSHFSNCLKVTNQNKTKAKTNTNLYLSNPLTAVPALPNNAAAADTKVFAHNVKAA